MVWQETILQTRETWNEAPRLISEEVVRLWPLPEWAWDAVAMAAGIVHLPAALLSGICSFYSSAS